jgi:excisionase family DNA binding protein
MTAPNLWDALLATLDDEHAAQLAERVRAHLSTDHRLLTATEAAQRLGLHPKTVVRMAREGRLPAARIGNGWRFHADQLHPSPPPPATTPKPQPALRAVTRRRDEPASVRAIRGDRPRKAA